MDSAAFQERLYSGSVEYFNFGEAQDRKGMLLVDLESGRAESVPVKPRYMIAIILPLIAAGCAPRRLPNACWSCARRMRSKTGWFASISKTSIGPLTANRSGKGFPAGSLCALLQDPAEFLDEEEHFERSIDRRTLHEEFFGYLEEESSKELMPAKIRMM